VNRGGKLRRVYFFVLVLPYSDAMFVQAFDHARTEMFWEFHRRAFEYLGGVPRRISYDNDKVLVSAVTGKRARRLTCGFTEPARVPAVAESLPLCRALLRGEPAQ